MRDLRGIESAYAYILSSMSLGA